MSGALDMGVGPYGTVKIQDKVIDDICMKY